MKSKLKSTDSPVSSIANPTRDSSVSTTMALRSMAFLTVSLGVFCPADGTESESRRLLADGEVVASQRYFAVSWRRHFNEGDALHCGFVYSRSSALHFDFGPASADAEAWLGLRSPAVFRGQVEILEFWNATITTLGLKDMKAYEPDGAFSSTALVVDDDTVIVEGRFAFTSSRGQRIGGHIHSQTWVRVGEEWKIRSAIMSIEDVKPAGPLRAPLGFPEESGVEEEVVLSRTTSKEPVRSRTTSSTQMVEEIHEIRDDEQEPFHSEDEEEEEQPTTRRPVHTTKRHNKSALPEVWASSTTSLRNATSRSTATHHAKQSSSPDFALLLVMVLLTIAAAAYLIRRSKRRREASIAGFEAMLG